MSVEERLRTTLAEAAEVVPDRPGDLDRIVGDGERPGGRYVGVGLAAVAVLVLVFAAGSVLWPDQMAVEIGPAGSDVVADGRLPDGSWRAQAWPEGGETCIEVDHPSAGTVERCVAPLGDGQLADLAPGGAADAAGRAHPSLLGLVSPQVSHVVVVLADRSVVEIEPRSISWASESTVAVAFPTGRNPVEAQLYDAEDRLVDRLLFTRDGEQVGVPIATLNRPVGPDDTVIEDDDYSWPADEDMPRTGARGLGGDPARFAARFDDVWIHLHTGEMQRGSPAICMSIQIPAATASACTEVTGPLDGIVLDYSPTGRARFVVGVVTDGHDHVLVDGQRVEVVNNVFHAAGVSDDPDIRIPDGR